jgi:hypothetical protein
MPEEPSIPYVTSPQFRTIFVDGMSSVALGDAFGARLLVTMTRLDVFPIRERVRLIEGHRIELIPGVIPDVMTQKTVEIIVEMRPDTALQMANNLLDGLQLLDPVTKAKYGIPPNLMKNAGLPPPGG